MFSMVDKLYSSRTREGHAILSETRWPAPSLCVGSVDSRAVFLRSKFFFETRPGTVQLCEHFRGSTNQHAIPNRKISAKEKEILLMWCTTIWQTTPISLKPSPPLLVTSGSQTGHPSVLPHPAKSSPARSSLSTHNPAAPLSLFCSRSPSLPKSPPTPSRL